MKWRGLVAAGITAGAAVGAGGACGEPTIPDRSGFYSFADTVFVGPDVFVDVFNWPASRLPVRFWADPRGNMGFLVAFAVEVWQDQFLYGEFRGVLVADSTRADVIVRWTDSVPPDAPPDTTPPNSCSGVTSFDFDTTGNAWAGPIHVSLRVLTGGVPASPERVQGCMRRVAIHELGHSLGLLRHSPNPQDIMIGSPVANYPSLVDRRTVEVLYHSPPTIGPPPP